MLITEEPPLPPCFITTAAYTEGGVIRSPDKSGLRNLIGSTGLLRRYAPRNDKGISITEPVPKRKRRISPQL